MSNVNVKSVSNPTSTHPEVGVSIGAVLIDPADAQPLTSTGPHGTSRGFRVYTTYVLEWEIELPVQGPTMVDVTVQHFNAYGSCGLSFLAYTFFVFKNTVF